MRKHSNDRLQGTLDIQLCRHRPARPRPSALGAVDRSRDPRASFRLEGCWYELVESSLEPAAPW